MEKDDLTWLKICYGFLGLLFAYVAYKAILTLGVQFSWVERYDRYFSMINNLVAILIGVLGVFFLQKDHNRRDYHLATIAEVRKVTWPSVPDTKKMTIIVAIVVAIFSVILSVFDIIWYRILQIFLS